MTPSPKKLLQCRRPNGADDGDPFVRSALDAASRDAELATWASRERSFDAAVSETLRTVRAPGDLRAAILAGEAPARRTTRPRADWWRSPALLAFAAALTLAATLPLAVRALTGPVSEQTYVAALMRDFASDEHAPRALGGRGALRTLLASPSLNLTSGVPLSDSQLREAGCRSVRIAGIPVLEVCFFHHGVEYHLYIAPAERLALAAEKTTSLAEETGIATALWRAGGRVYLLAGPAEAGKVSKLLGDPRE